ncbi:hypothetical protein [Sporosarcina sp. FSL K6-2383]|uniref:hypothetical protein n=1 Tax=Sporosarcina sp. FSL K6-2383 TaxID=2921556 RepID=UPI00315A0457
MKKKLLAGVLGLALLLPSQVLANDSYKDLELPAGKVDLSTLPIEFQEILSKRTDEINNYFDVLQELNFKAELAKKEVEKQEKFGVVSMNILSKFNEVNNKLEYYDNNSLEIVGLEKIGHENDSPLMQPFSSKTQAAIDKPTVYYDNDSQSYVATTNWIWNQANGDIDNTGRDGVGIGVTQEVLSLFDTHVSTWDTRGNKYWPSKSTEASAHGYHIVFDDNSNGATYTAHKGTSWMFFRFYNAKPVGKLVNFNSRYDHTWNKVTINGVSISVSGIGLNFSSGSGWTTTNYSGIRF